MRLKGTEHGFKEKLISIRRAIHRHPELGNQEFRTTDLIEKTLKAARIPVKRFTRTGVVGLIEGGRRELKRPGKTFALRADIDALPVQEKTGKPYASVRPGIMHACGHDANATMALGAALLLGRERESFSGSVKLIFQPNEESSGGAKTLLDAGVLKKPDVDAIVGIHVSPWLESGVLGLKPGEMMAAVDRFTIEVIGTGGHGAYPHMATDAVVVASQVVAAFQGIVSRETDPTEPAVITVGTIHGGERFNIVCGKVTMIGTVRTLNERLRKQIRESMEKKLRCITAASNAGYTFDYEELGNPLTNSADILELCRLSGNSVLGEDRVRTLETPSMGGEDFAEYLQYVPGCFIYIGTGMKKSYPWHHEKFDINEDVLPLGARLLADIAKRFLNK